MPTVIQVKRGTASSWTSANTVLAAGEMGFETDTKKMKVGDGSTAWTSLAYTATDGDITGVTAGTGLSGGGASGAVTLTNSMATEITAKGDLIVGTGNAVFDNLIVGTNGQVLTADSTTPTGLKYATPASGALTLITRQTFTNVATTTTTFDNCFTSTYKAYQIVMESIDPATNSTFLYFQWRYAGPTTQSATYYGAAFNFDHNGTTTGTAQPATSQAAVLKASASSGSGLGTMVNLNVTGVGNTSQRPLVTSIGTSVANTGPTIMGVINDTARTYTGFILSAASGNISGTVAVYGLATS